MGAALLDPASAHDIQASAARVREAVKRFAADVARELTAHDYWAEEPPPPFAPPRAACGRERAAQRLERLRACLDELVDEQMDQAKLAAAEEIVDG